MDSFVSESTEIPKKKLFQIELSRDGIVSASVEAVIINSLPLPVYEKTGIRKLLTPILDKLDISLNRASMKDRGYCKLINYVSKFQLRLRVNIFV